MYPVVVDRLRDYYRQFVKPENIVYDKSVAAAHSMVTENYGHPCAYQGDGNRPEDIFINDCDYDAAGKLLAHIPGTAQRAGDDIVRIDRRVRPGGVHRRPGRPQHEPFRLCVHPGRLRRRRRLPRARRLPRLPPLAGPDRRPVPCERWLQPLGRFEPDRRAVSANDQQRSAACLQPARRLGLVGLRRSGLREAAWAADARGNALKLMLDRVASGYSGANPRPAYNLTTSPASEHSVALQWAKSQGPRLAAYNVYYSRRAEGPFARAGTTEETRATVTGLVSGTTYYFVVRAVSRRSVESADSNLASAATPGLPPLPGTLTPVIALLP